MPSSTAFSAAVFGSVASRAALSLLYGGVKVRAARSPPNISTKNTFTARDSCCQLDVSLLVLGISMLAESA